MLFRKPGNKEKIAAQADNKISSKIILRNHSFSTYARFSEKLTFLTP